MRIVDVRTHVLEAELDEPFGWSFDSTTKRGSCLVEIEVEGGLVGWGECFGPARLNAAVVAAFGKHLIGADAMAHDAIWLTLYNRFRDQGQKGLVVTAISGVDIALWDLKGKILGRPVHQIMGGPLRSRVQAYATGTYRRGSGDPMEYIVDEVRGYVDQGFEAVKLKIGFNVAEDAALIRAVRAAIGKDKGLMLDANHGYDALEAIALGQAVADQDIGWFEEPVVPDDLASYREVRQRQPIPVAGGECEFTRWGFLNVLTTRSIDILQPDTCAAGGLSECKKIADMAAAFGVRYVPHVWGTGIGLAAALQLLAVLPHTPPRHTPREPLLEFDRSEHPFRQAVLASPIEHKNGWVDVPAGPGLGIEVDRTAIQRFTVA
ncbi:MAG: mandelate racemase/muconate lactonizing enzyme family protein [Mesorhizobium sp.]|uniref:mandelate racemase/muconate lactonizing enzyme family protein n=1 Tax=Mesorhizobium sp. TaxID=1871066 RepID=UPI000FE9F9ED|nr:mandelate racemase/muconate lactonizing enzyme family protein [Mesorhizobium sp.]RWH94079.1 MAG: mandelate racemase/muconate lactonizing enzyme family protein [Mesorhizobium sp.]RWK82708.1 MAG: mandelate racemase/muconate lactonizing enzyme family protein [Mesorhizobium sp.]RWL06515.1 MAG: mandelate racemase/muconate lactonizing enzyme family protein [Mesorhizobium sp.]